MNDRDGELIGVLPKSFSEDVRIVLSTFVTGRPHLHVRTYATFGDGPDRGPTRKGASLPVAALPELIELLSLALDRARERGMIE